MKIRVKFSKEGELRFIGHLDMMRFFQKAIRRAGIPVSYSAGFNPHPLMSFASPLGIGLTSVGEYMDLEVPQSGPSAEMKERLNAEMAEGARILSWKRLPDGAKNAMASLAAADYSLCFRPGYGPADLGRFFAGLESFCGREHLPAEKKSKKSVRQIDLRPLIYGVSAAEDSVFLRVAAGSADFLKPELVAKTYCREIGETFSPGALQIRRLEMYANTGEEGTLCLVPLDSLGEDIG